MKLYFKTSKLLIRDDSKMTRRNEKEMPVAMKYNQFQFPLGIKYELPW